MLLELELHLVSKLSMPSEARCFLTTNAVTDHKSLESLCSDRWVSNSNFQGVMKWSKRPKSLTEKGEFGPHTSPISALSKGGIGCLLALAGWYKPPTGFCHKPYEVTAEPQSRAPHLLHSGHVIH